MSIEKLENCKLEIVSGGQIGLDDVMGVKGLSMCTGSPTINNPDGVFWRYHGIALTKDEAFNKLKKHATRPLGSKYTDEAYLQRYIDEYNNEVDGVLI